MPVKSNEALPETAAITLLASLRVTAPDPSAFPLASWTWAVARLSDCNGKSLVAEVVHAADTCPDMVMLVACSAADSASGPCRADRHLGRSLIVLDRRKRLRRIERVCCWVEPQNTRFQAVQDEIDRIAGRGRVRGQKYRVVFWPAAATRRMEGLSDLVGELAGLGKCAVSRLLRGLYACLRPSEICFPRGARPLPIAFVVAIKMPRRNCPN